MGALLGIAALALVGTAGALWFRRIHQVRIPADRTGFVAVWAAGAGLGLLSLLLSPGWLGGIAAGIALAVGGLLCVLVAISAQRVGDVAVRVGQTLPAFQAPDEHGKMFELASLAGRPVLLKFFRGHW